VLVRSDGRTAIALDASRLGEHRPLGAGHRLAIRDRRATRQDLLRTAKRKQRSRFAHARVAHEWRRALADTRIGGQRRTELPRLLVQPSEQKIIAKALACGRRCLFEPTGELTRGVPGRAHVERSRHRRQFRNRQQRPEIAERK